ncbi:hypothetical protein TNCV_2185571 [Trichonephila clavipes]|nr:hypothetical protein TNCV_2185571 [Trichonephila clavipes]
MQREDPVLSHIIKKIDQNEVSPQVSNYFINGEGSGLLRNLGCASGQRTLWPQGYVLARTVESNQGGGIDGNESVTNYFRSGAVSFNRTTRHFLWSLYKQILRPVITYGSPVWGAAAATHMNKIQVIQNKILRVMTNAPCELTDDLTDDFETRNLGCASILLSSIWNSDVLGFANLGLKSGA